MTLRPYGSFGGLRGFPVVLLVVLLWSVSACSTSESAPGGAADDVTEAAESLTTGIAAEGCDGPLVAGSSSVVCAGMVVELGTPEECLSAPCGLIVDFHPSNWTGKEVEQLTSMQRLGNDAGYVVMQPTSPGGRWAFSDARVRVRTIMDSIIEALDIDTSRVHVGGGSAGGFMTWQFVCDHADLIASAAPLAAGTGDACRFDADSSPAEEVDILQFHGRHDTTVPFAEGIAQRDLVVESWDMTQTKVLADEPDYVWSRWTNERGTVLEFIEYEWTTADGSGHCAPGAAGQGGCGTDTAVDYGQAALEFYIAHPKNS